MARKTITEDEYEPRKYENEALPRPMGPWRTVRVVVEVPVRGKFTEKDLSWSVDRALASDGFWQDRKYLPKVDQPIFGRVRVKEFGRGCDRSDSLPKGRGVGYMTPRQLAQRIARLDWSGVTLQHLLAVTAACETLAALPVQEDTNVVPMFPAPLRPDQLRGCSYTPDRRVMLTYLDGTPFADALCSRAERWDWIVEAVCEGLRCGRDDVTAGESDEGDTVLVRGQVAFLISIDR